MATGFLENEYVLTLHKDEDAAEFFSFWKEGAAEGARTLKDEGRLPVVAPPASLGKPRDAVSGASSTEAASGRSGGASASSEVSTEEAWSVGTTLGGLARPEELMESWFQGAAEVGDSTLGGSSDAVWPAQG